MLPFNGLLQVLALAPSLQVLAISSSNVLQSIKLARLRHDRQLSTHADLQSLDTTPNVTVQQHNFTQPLDHFEDTGFTFQQRYWVNDQYYQPGGPVIVLDSGESPGMFNLGFLQQGIIQILANATGGLGIVLEHRYYGSSIPVLNFTTDSLRCVSYTSLSIDYCADGM